MAQSRRREPSLYIGVDVGGTKVLAALVQSTGEIVARHRCPTPRDASPEATVEAIMQAMEGALADQGLTSKALKGIGLTIPGVVDPAAGHIVVTPNMNLTGITIGPLVTQRFGVPVVIGNDVNMGTLGEKWLGAARRARSAVGIMVGTGIGGGVIVDGKLVTGCREAAGEIGHMVVQIGGPQCGCGNYGCLEALASRTAIERDIRQAIADGKQTLVEDLLKETDGLVKSSVLRKALKAGDKVVTQIMQRASEVLGYGCLTVRHLLDPDVIVLGGGVIEACGRFVLPIVRGIVASDALAGARPGSYIAESELGDDAVVYGAVALAMTECGEDPSEAVAHVVPDYPKIDAVEFGSITVDGQPYETDVHLYADGTVKKRSKKRIKKIFGSSHKVGVEELDRACKGHPDRLIIGTGFEQAVELTPEGAEFLAARGVEARLLATPKAVQSYNRSTGRRAAIIHVTC